MKLRSHSLKLFFLVLLTCFLLNSCYFNSAGHILEMASYEAAVVTSDLKPGSTIYADNGNYYVELPRYKAGKPVVTQYPQSDQNEQESASYPLRATGETTMVRISSAFATYLMGQQSVQPSNCIEERVKADEELLKRRSQSLAVVRTPERVTQYGFRYDSPGALGWYSLGMLDWLCVDLPITCVENSLMLAGGCLVLMDQTYKASKTVGYTNYSSGYSSYSSGYSSYSGGSSHCSGCKGEGLVVSSGRAMHCGVCGGTGYSQDEWQRMWDSAPASMTVKCAYCSGTGRNETGLLKLDCVYCGGMGYRTGAAFVSPCKFKDESETSDRMKRKYGGW